MNQSTIVCCLLLAGLGFTLISFPSATASLCQTIRASSGYPQSALPDRNVSVITTVAGSCTSDGEDYFAVRVDLIDSTSNMILSSNSTPIGYNANNFTVSVRNAAISPNGNQSWAIDVNTYLIQAGGTSGKYLVNSTVITIQIGQAPVAEFKPGLTLILTLCVIGLILSRRNPPKKHRTMEGHDIS